MPTRPRTPARPAPTTAVGTAAALEEEDGTAAAFEEDEAEVDVLPLVLAEDSLVEVVSVELL